MANGTTRDDSDRPGAEASPSQRPKLWAEAPIRKPDDARPLFEQAERMLQELRDVPVESGAVVAAIVGGRGSGKTSLLNMMGHAALEAPDHWVVARDDTIESMRPSLLEPGRASASDPLLYLLLDYFKRVPGPGGVKPPAKRSQGSTHGGRVCEGLLDELERTAALRTSPKAFIELAKELTTSNETLAATLAKAHADGASTAAELRDNFGKLVTRLTSGEARPHDSSGTGARGGAGGKRLLILVDDIDLRPSVALELLEMLHEFLDHQGLVVVLSFDHVLCLHALDQRLRDKKRNIPGLAQALLEKLVPIRRPVPAWEQMERLAALWPRDLATSPVAPVLPTWWPESAERELRRAFLFNAEAPAVPREDTAQDSAVPREDTAQDSLPTTVREFAERLLAPLLPDTPRRLKALHNELCFDRQAYDSETAPHAEVRSLVRRFVEEWNRTNTEGTNHGDLPTSLYEPVWTMLRAVDISAPELTLVARLRRRAGEVFEILDRSILHRKDVSKLQGFLSERWEAGFATGESPDKVRLHGVATLMAQFARSLLLLSPPTNPGPNDPADAAAGERDARGGPSARRFAPGRDEAPERLECPPECLAVSMDADASAVFRPWWDRNFASDAFHELILAAPGAPYGRPPIESFEEFLEQRRAELDALANQRELALVIGGKAPLSILLTLGWMVRYRTLAGCMNDHQGTVTWFPAPRERIRARRTEQREFLQHQSHAQSEKGRRDEAIVLVDLLSTTSLDALMQFDGLGERNLRRYRLAPREQLGTLQPEQVRPLLQDVVEELQSLKDDGVTTFHLALVCPDVFATMLGFQIHALGRFTIYEWERSSSHYSRALEIGTGPDPSRTELFRRRL